MQDIVIKWLSNVTGIIFDLDGTLLNSEPIHYKSIKTLISNLKFEIPFNEKIFFEKYHGMSDSEVFEDLAQTHCDLYLHYTEETFLQEKARIFFKIIDSMADSEFQKLMTPGIQSFINKIHGHYTLAVISASEQEVVDRLILKTGLKNYFKFCWGRSSYYPTKPSPDPYIKGMQCFGMTPEKILIFEDSPTGLQSAKASRANVVQVTCFCSPNHSFIQIPDYHVLI